MHLFVPLKPILAEFLGEKLGKESWEEETRQKAPFQNQVNWQFLEVIIGKI